MEKAAALTPQNIVDEVKASGLRGRGGAAFPAGIKWQTVLDEPHGQQKYVVCNADEGDSGTFADRLVMECDPYMLIEGMAIAGLAVSAIVGFIYLRSEYLLSEKMLNEAIRRAEARGYLGDNICDSGRAFRLEVRLGAGAYICGEETSLLESLEGKRGLVRSKPTLPAIKGLFGQSTVVNNVLSLAAIPYIMANDGKAYADYGMGHSLGTLPIQLAGNIKQGGLIELAFGVTLRKVLEDFGAGTFTCRPIKAVQACPTSTLMEKSVIEEGLPDHSVVTTCAYCGVGCSFKAEMKGGQVLRMVPYKGGEANHGHSCVKGRFAFGYATHEDRIREPMIRDSINDPWKVVSWDEALAFSAKKLKDTQAQYGRESIGGITSSRCTNEETYLVQKLVRAAFGNNNTDTCARVCHSPTGYGLKTNLALATGNIGKEGGGVNPLRGQNNVQGEDIAQSDPNTQHVESALKALDCLIVQDIFLNETAKFAHGVIPCTTTIPLKSWMKSPH